ncbi:hypothetical protein P3655_08875 [Vibrio parahaemolyticus]|nr:hypothetical protein [Vibrio parahaemolyticus]MCX8941542.1 hypothetical protein [Vibrio parahaemolyticus]MDF5225128.1 hypothetical protein [Vibrio parahaemolyticus]MDF5623402.1 hypothetical protein [Vibrio parahaemolyticus]TOJ30734.1 hypothetical protein CGI43_03600 [Vibrio parahaemolyticus]
MKKIDLHVHTVVTPSDPYFDYSLDTLRRYVTESNIDCIAITNHNKFDKEQFLLIREELSKTVVFPGIEVDLEGGHILVIADNSDVEDFSSRCSLVTKDIPDAKSDIDYNRFIEIFEDLSKYIIIPHIDKTPSIKKPTLHKLGGVVTCGEVQSVKKFLYALNGTGLTPVLFSDMRAKRDLEHLPVRQTYVDVGELTHSSLKTALKNSDKLALTEKEGNRFFQVLDNGLEISTGLNVLLGQRSSGKSHTLNEIFNYSENEKIKYIKQFELLERSDSDDESKFESKLRDGKKHYITEYLKEFKSVIDDVKEINITQSEKSIEKYLESLKQFAENQDRHDSFSSTAIFSEEQYKPTSLSSIEELIKSVRNILDNVNYKNIIDQHINRDGLINLLKDLIVEHNREYKINAQKLYVNSIIRDAQAQLNVQSATAPISEVDLYKTALDRKNISKFESIVGFIKTESQESIESIYGYNVVARKEPYKGANELRRNNGNKGRFSDAYEKYDNAYEFLQELKEIETIDKSQLHTFFCDINYEVLNSLGYKVSGGERSEFRLLQNINDAYNYDMLMIDEPESSFDNVFLLNKVNKIIKDLSKNMPVILVTHNNTVGASISPDYLLYTRKDVIDGEVTYNIFYGHPTDRVLHSLDGKTQPNYDVIINCLEAGAEPYRVRGDSYEAIKN